jgi:hypothetical protein
VIVGYWLQDVDLDGTATWHGPVQVQDGGAAPPADLDAPLLNRAQAGRRDVTPGRGAAVDAGTPATAPVVSVEGAREAPVVSQASKMLVLPDSPADVQHVIAGGAAIKVSIDDDGWYRIAQPALAAAGLAADARSSDLQLWADGVEQPLRVTPAGGVFGPASTIEFYGTAADTPYTGTRVYWLTAGYGHGRRIPAANAETGLGAETTSFPFTVEHKDRDTYFAALLNGEADNFFGELVTNEPTDIEMPVAHLDRSATASATLEVVLQGVTDTSEAPAGHHVAVAINGTSIGDVELKGRANVAMSFAFDASQLVEGRNLVTLTARGGDADVTLVDRLRLTYAHPDGGGRRAAVSPRKAAFRPRSRASAAARFGCSTSPIQGRSSSCEAPRRRTGRPIRSRSYRPPARRGRSWR